MMPEGNGSDSLPLEGKVAPKEPDEVSEKGAGGFTAGSFFVIE